MTLEELKQEHAESICDLTSMVSKKPNMVQMGPSPIKSVPNFSNIDAGLCPYCMAIVKDVTPSSPHDQRIVHWQCIENASHKCIVVDESRKFLKMD